MTSVGAIWARYVFVVAGKARPSCCWMIGIGTPPIIQVDPVVGDVGRQSFL